MVRRKTIIGITSVPCSSDFLRIGVHRCVQIQPEVNRYAKYFYIRVVYNITRHCNYLRANAGVTLNLRALI